MRSAAPCACPRMCRATRLGAPRRPPCRAVGADPNGYIFFAQALHQPLAATVFLGNSVHGPYACPAPAL